MANRPKEGCENIKRYGIASPDSSCCHSLVISSLARVTARVCRIQAPIEWIIMSIMRELVKTPEESSLPCHDKSDKL